MAVEGMLHQGTHNQACFSLRCQVRIAEGGTGDLIGRQFKVAPGPGQDAGSIEGVLSFSRGREPKLIEIHCGKSEPRWRIEKVGARHLGEVAPVDVEGKEEGVDRVSTLLVGEVRLPCLHQPALRPYWQCRGIEDAVEGLLVSCPDEFPVGMLCSA